MKVDLLGYEIELREKSSSSQPSSSPEIEHELLSRIQSFFGDQGLARIRDSFVIVVGLGGVGSHCAHMLGRSGVGKLRLIDFDQVTLSSLNRHAVATMKDVGISKVRAMKEHLQEIVPWCEIDAIQEMFVLEEAPRLLQGNPTFVVDCIDDLKTKAELIAFCLQNQLPVLTSLGAGGKADPTRLRIAPLSDCINDPLAQKLKWRIKKFNVLAEDVMSVFSIEKPVCNLLPLDDEQREKPQEYGVVDYLRIRILPVLGTSPSIFGQALASYLLCKMGGKTYEPEACERISKNLKHKLRQLLRNNEIKKYKTDQSINLDDDDIEFIVHQVWKSRCPVTQKRFGGHVILTLVRWNENLPPGPDNLVLLMQSEAQKLMDGGQSAFNAEVRQKIESRLRWAATVAKDIYYPTNNTTAMINVQSKPPGGNWNIPIFCLGIIVGVVVSRSLMR